MSKHPTKVVQTNPWWVATCNRRDADQDALPYAIFMLPNSDSKNEADARSWAALREAEGWRVKVERVIPMATIVFPREK